jgi:hypothetical protein
MEGFMKISNQVVTIMLAACSVGALAQCTKPEINPSWDASKGEFRCIDPAAEKGFGQDENVSPTGTKDFCSTVRENLLKVCPQSDEGKACRSKAKSIFNACYKDTKDKGPDSPRSANTANPSSKTDASACMATFRQQQQACQSRKISPASPGQPSAPDTCLQDAIAAQNKCLANSR